MSGLSPKIILIFAKELGYKLEHFAFKILQILNAALPSFQPQASCGFIRRGRMLTHPPERFDEDKSQTALIIRLGGLMAVCAAVLLSGLPFILKQFHYI